MSDLNLDNIVGFKAVDKDGNEQNVTVDEMVDMVSTRMVMALSETSTFAAVAATGNDVYENELPTVTDAANVRVLQSSGDAAQMTMKSLASKLGELIGISSFFKPHAPVPGEDFDKMLNMGFYKIQSLDSSINPNGPKDAYPYGVLIVFDNPLDYEKRKAQIYIPNGNPFFYIRSSNNGAFYKWNKFNGNEL